MVDRIVAHEITVPKLESICDFGRDFEASVNAASDRRSPQSSSAAPGKIGAQTAKPDDGGKPTGDELARKALDALNDAMRGNYGPAMKLLGQLEGKQLSEFSCLLKGIEGLGTKAGNFVPTKLKSLVCRSGSRPSRVGSRPSRSIPLVWERPWPLPSEEVTTRRNLPR
jgi:hypothetical protein